MPISACEYCGKPINSIAVKLCANCSKEIEETYVKARRYIYKNPKTSDFISIIQETEVPEKALSYLVNKGRIVIADRAAGDRKCRVCGKEADGGALCQSCMSKILKEKLASHRERQGGNVGTDSGGGDDKKRVIPTSFNKIKD